AFMRARTASGLPFGQAEWDRILDSYATSVPGLQSRSRTDAGAERLDRELLAEATTTALQLIRRDVLDVPKDSILADAIVIRNDQSLDERTRPVSAVLGEREVVTEARREFQLRYQTDPVAASITGVFFARIFVPNLRYDRIATRDKLQQARSEVSPTFGIVRENEVIVRRGDVITEETLRRLVSLEQEMNERSGASQRWWRILGQFLLTGATFLMFYLYLYLLRPQIFSDNRLMFLITLLFLGMIAMFGVAMRLALVNMFMIPVAVVAILLTVIFDSRVGLFGTLTLALLGSHLLNYDFNYTFATLFAGTLGIFSVRDIRNRGQFFLSAGVVLVGYVLVLTATWLLQNKPLDRFTDELIFVSINALLMLLAYPMLWIFERMFGITTDLTLLELSDTNRPLLKELSLKASGTFNHVLQVANLAEAAAASVGANALMTRVGALYHDVGKMIKPEYFVENQRQGSNPHDGLKPRMSALIIASHVKEGIEIGRKYRLPQEVLDFIPMHHGTTRIEYFYRRALDQQKEESPDILESEFRYPGPKPNTRETGILMLADSVEAASRTLENPTHKRLENLIDSIVDARRDDGQLDETNLTFAEIDVIKDAFLNVLMGIYHVRVKYPGDEPKKGAAARKTPALTGIEDTEAGAEASVPDGPEASVQETGSDAAEGGSNGSDASPATVDGDGAGDRTSPPDPPSSGDEAADAVERRG
ncbi:MAG: HDIG domain-containing protein, partial [Rhodothermales bacterium]|nr:HDIG domain-containing protein [Rhodothermales bacterium]